MMSLAAGNLMANTMISAQGTSPFNCHFGCGFAALCKLLCKTVTPPPSQRNGSRSYPRGAREHRDTNSFKPRPSDATSAASRTGQCHANSLVLALARLLGAGKSHCPDQSAEIRQNDT